MRLGQASGASLYGAIAIAGDKGERQPSADELDGARYQGELEAKSAARLA